MKMVLAVAVSCDSTGCQLAPAEGGPPYKARYSALMQNRLTIHPGQLVAVDLEPAVPEMAWRWHRAQVIEPGPSQVLVQGHDSQLSVIRVPGLEVDVRAGDEVWVTGTDGPMELHAKVVDGKPSNPAGLREKILPRIIDALAKMEKQRG